MKTLLLLLLLSSCGKQLAQLEKIGEGIYIGCFYTIYDDLISLEKGDYIYFAGFEMIIFEKEILKVDDNHIIIRYTTNYSDLCYSFKLEAFSDILYYEDQTDINKHLKTNNKAKIIEIQLDKK